MSKLGYVIFFFIWIAYLLGISSSFLSTTNLYVIQLFGFLVPWLLLALIICTIVLVFTKIKWIWLPIATVLLTYPVWTRQINLSISNDSKFDKTLQVATLNTRNLEFMSRKGSELQSIVDNDNIELLCLQEIDPKRYNLLKKLEILPYSAHYGEKQNVCIFSKYPLTDIEPIKLNSQINNALMANVFLPSKDTISLVCLHLKSNQVTGLSNKISKQNIQNKQLWQQAFTGVKRYINSSKKRLKEARLLSEKIKRTKHPVIVLGDMNDTPYSFTYATLKGNLQDGFQKKGNGFAKTYTGNIKGLKIDYIFASEGFKFLDYEILNSDISDHHLNRALLTWK